MNIKTGIYTYSYESNIHNVGGIDLRLPIGITPNNSDWVPVTAAQARRIKSHFCGIKECKCGSDGLVDTNGHGSMVIKSTRLIDKKG